MAKARASHQQSPKVQAFVEALCAVGEPTFGNATLAALAAGFGRGNRKTATQLGCRMRKQARVQKLIAERLAGAGVTGETIRLHVAGRFFSDKTSNADVARLGKLLAELTPNALAPQKLDHTTDGKPISIVVNGIVRDSA